MGTYPIDAEKRAKIIAALAKHGLDASEIFEDGWDQYGYYGIVRDAHGTRLWSADQDSLAREWHQWPSRQAYEDFFDAYLGTDGKTVLN